MELGVFDVGLKNRQLSGIRSFLRIQSTALTLLRASHQSEYQTALRQWIHVFDKLSAVASASVRDRGTDRFFGRDLSVVALSTAADLILILQADDSEPADPLEQAFVQSLLSSSRHIRAARLGNEALADECIGPPDPPALSLPLALDAGGEFLQWQLSQRRSGRGQWKEVVANVFQSFMRLLEQRDLRQGSRLLALVHLSLHQVLPVVATHSFDPKLRADMLRLGGQYLPADWKTDFEKLDRVTSLYEDVITFALNRRCIMHFMAPHVDALIHLMQEDHESDGIWSLLLDLNEEKRLLALCEDRPADEIINGTNGQTLTRERIFNHAFRLGSRHCKPEYLRQVATACFRRGDDMLQASHLFPALIRFCYEQQLHEFGLWLSLTPAAAADDLSLLCPSYALFRRTALTQVSAGELIIETMSLIGEGLDDEATAGLLVASLFDPSFASSSKREQIMTASLPVAQKSFPLIARSIKLSLSLVPDEEPFSSPYYLLRRTTNLRLDTVFLWQENNLFKTRDSEMPTFSRHNIHNFTGPDTEMDCMYYVREGRPLEGFRRIRHSAGDDPQLVRRVTDAACDGSKRLEIMSSAVIFQELANQNSCRLRLHLAIGNFVSRYAADFLGLKPRQQEQELGHLLRQAMHSACNQSVMKLLQLLLTAFERKFHESRRTSAEECFQWSLVTSFCREHSLDLPVDFLVKCAANDDWLMFLVFIQLYDYPKDLVLRILPSFNNGCIADHMQKAFLSSATSTERDQNPVSILKNSNSRSRDSQASRNSLYNRIGVRKAVVMSEARKLSPKGPTSIPDDDVRSVFSETDATNSADSMSVLSRDSSELHDNDKPCDWIHPPVDIYNLILYAQRKGDAALAANLTLSGIHLSNHVVVLLAASLPPDMNPFSPFDSMSFWLTAALRKKVPPQVIDNQWTVTGLVTVLQSALHQHNNLKVLNLGMELFDFESNPLFYLSLFLIEFLLEKKYQKSIEFLKRFQESYWKMKQSEDATPIETSIAVAELSVCIIRTCLSSMTNMYELKLLLRHMDFARVQNMFPSSIQVPNFNKLSRMAQCLSEVDFVLPINRLVWLIDPSSEYTDVVQSICDGLQLQSLFTESLQIVSISGVSAEPIVLSEWRIKSAVRKDDLSFWEDCFLAVKKHSVAASSLIPFLLTSISDINDRKAKTFVLIEVYRLSCESDAPQSQASILTQLFMSLIEDQVLDHESDPDAENIWSLRNKTLKYDPTCNPVCDAKPSVESNVLDRMVGKLVTISLDVGKMFAHIFQFQSRELDILTIGRTLVTVKSLSAEQADYMRHLMPDSKSTFRNLMTDEIISLLESLTLHLTHCTDFCRREVLLFKISVALNRSFTDVTSEDDIDILRCLVISASSDNISLAKELVAARNIEDNAMAQLLYHDLINSIKSTIDSAKDNVSIESSASGVDGNSFLSTLRLLNNPSVLGRLILCHLKDGVLDEFSMPVVVEFYIRAHDCFSVCSDIEGISIILRNVKYLVMQQLAPACDYSSMIRILTGIGRYSEMTYIFDILKEHHKFELLLGKRIEKVPQLRIALLDSLKGDKDMYPLVALNFSMHREIAEMLEADAIRATRGIGVLRKQANNVRDILERSLADFVDASESFSKSSCFNQAKKCANLAELVALQIHFLSSGIVLLNMEPASAAAFVADHSNCAEAMIVAEAYNQHRSWSSALFNHVVLKGDMTYLREYQQLAGAISPTVLEEVVSRAHQEGVLVPDSPAEGNINRLLTFCRDAEAAVRINRMTGLQIPHMDGDDGAYIKDLMRSTASQKM